MGEAGVEESAVTEAAARRREIGNARPKKMAYSHHSKPARLGGLLSSRDTAATKRTAPVCSSELAMRAHPPKRLATQGLSLQYPAPTKGSPSVLRPLAPVHQERIQDTTPGGVCTSLALQLVWCRLAFWRLAFLSSQRPKTGFLHGGFGQPQTSWTGSMRRCVMSSSKRVFKKRLAPRNDSSEGDIA